MEQFELPEGWEWKTLGNLGTVFGGGTPAKSRNDFWNGDIPWVSPKEMKRWQVGEAALNITAQAVAQSAARLIPEPAVLFVVRGMILAHTVPIAVTTCPIAINQDMKAIVPGDDVDAPFLAYMMLSKHQDLLGMVEIAGHGTRKLESERWRALPIAVPPLPEQRRLVARIEAQTRRVETIRKSQQEFDDEMRGVLAGYYAEITADAEWKSLSEVAPQVRRPVAVQAGQSYPELGIRSFGKGTFHKPAISAEQLGTKRLFHIHPGDLIFNNVFAWECAVAVVKPEDAGRVGSHRFITCVPKPGVATTPFLYFHFTTEQGLHDLGDASPGGAGRNRTLGLKNLAAIRVPVPSHDKQVVFARLWDKVETTRRLQAELKADLAAYVPSVLAKAFRGEL